MYRRYAEALGNDSRMDKLEDTYSTGKNLWKVLSKTYNSNGYALDYIVL